MTCFPDLMADPSILDDPDGGHILYWRCCGRTWYLSVTDQQPEREWRLWHLAAEVVQTARA